MSYRILLINWQDIANPQGGGAEVHAHEIFKRVAAAGHEVVQLSCRFKGARREETIDSIRIIRRGWRSAFNFFVPGAYFTLRNKYRFDVVFDDINKIPFFTPLYVTEPLIAIVHHFFGESIFLETGKLQAWYVRTSERAVPPIYRNTHFITVSESSRRELIGLCTRCSRVDIVGNAVDQQRYYADTALKAARPLIGYFGRLKKYKCVEHVIDALPGVLEKVPNASLLIVGDGDHRAELERYAVQMGVAHKVRFTGAVSPEDKVTFLNKMWVVANPSPKEGWGLTVIEANACGTPVVAANSPGLRDSVKNDRTGKLYEWGRTEQLAEYLVKILLDRSMRTRLQRNAVEWSKKFNWDASAAKMLDIIAKIRG